MKWSTPSCASNFYVDLVSLRSQLYEKHQYLTNRESVTIPSSRGSLSFLHKEAVSVFFINRRFISSRISLLCLEAVSSTKRHTVCFINRQSHLLCQKALSFIKRQSPPSQEAISFITRQSCLLCQKAVSLIKKQSSSSRVSLFHRKAVYFIKS